MTLRPIAAAAAALAVLATLAAAALLVVVGRAPVRVNVRWTVETSEAERLALQRQFGLTAGAPLAGTTWQYLITDHSPANLEALVTHPRVEDTYNLDRITFRPIEVPWDLRRLAVYVCGLAAAGAATLRLLQRHVAPRRFWVVVIGLWAVSALTSRSPSSLQLALALTLAAAIVMALNRRGAAAARAAALVMASPAVWCWSCVPPPARWLAAVVLAWATIVLPYIAVGPWDIEEYFTAVAATKVGVTALMQGAWPFWSLDFGIGAPQPLRFHFITHPLAPLCAVAPCDAVLRGVTSLHVLAGALCLGLLALRLTANRLLAGVAGVSYCLSSSAVQPMLVDDWSMTALNESALPVMLYAALSIGDAADRRGPLWWTLVLGGTAGLILSMSFPAVLVAIVAIIALSGGRLRQRLPWLMLAAAIALLMGAGHLHHLYEQVGATPAGVGRRDHGETGLGVLLWSTLLRPLFGGGQPPEWRTVFIGPPLAVAAIAAWVGVRRAAIRPLQIGLACGLVGLLVPPAWLFNINTAQWTYRTPLNVFAILLGVYGVHVWTSAPARRHWLPRFAALQCGWIAIAVVPWWFPVMARATGLSAERRLAAPSAAAEAIAEEYARRPGRVMLGPNAEVAARRLPSGQFFVAPNQLQIAGVPAVSAVVWGITVDELYPMAALIEGEFKGEAATVGQKPFLDALGIRYVLAFRDDPIAPGLREIRRFTPQMRLYENPDAWPEGFFVDRLPTARVPRLAGCPHDRFLCADFSRYDFARRAEPLAIIRIGDGVRLSFAPVDAVRYLVLTHWYQPGWTVAAGQATLSRVAEQLIGLRVEPNETEVVVRYLPPLRRLLLVTGIAIELAVGAAILLLWIGPWRFRRTRPRLNALPRPDQEPR